MIELNAPTLTAPDIFSLIPTLQTAGPVESIDPSAPVGQDFSALLTELIGPVETPAAPLLALQVPQAMLVGEVPEGPVSHLLPPAAENGIVPLTEEDGREAAGGRSDVGLPIEHSDPKKIVEIEPFIAFAPFVPFVADGSVSGPLEPISDFGFRTSDLGSSLTEIRNPKSVPGGRSDVELPIEHWADVQKFEFKVQQETMRPADARPQPPIAPAPSESQKPAMVTSDPIANAQQQQLPPRVMATQQESQKPAMVTSDPIANTQQQQLPPRVTAIQQEAQKPAIVTSDPIANTQQQLPPRVPAIQKVTIEARLPERGPKSETAPASDDKITSPAVHFSDVASASGSATPVEQARPAHHVEIPSAPHVQVVRTVAMEVGGEDSQVVIRIQERNGNVSLQMDAATEPMRQSLQSTVGSLVQALRREDVRVSSVEVSRKSPIEKVRRMKEAH